MDVLKPIDMLAPKAFPLRFTTRSGDIPPFHTYSEESVAAPLWSNVGGLVVGSISYHRSWDPAPPATACAVQMASVVPRRGSAAATACSKRPSSVSRTLVLLHCGALGGALNDATGTVKGPLSLGPAGVGEKP